MLRLRCNGQQILLDPEVKRAVNLTGVARVDPCLLIAVLPTTDYIFGQHSVDVDYSGSRCW